MRDSRRLILCDENGVPLPKQKHLSVEAGGVGSPDHIVVRFIVDGDDLRYVGEEAALLGRNA